MTIPQVNALATDRNREQAARICELKGLEYPKNWRIQGGDTVYLRHEPPIKYIDASGCSCTKFLTDICSAPNGSFTLDQVVGMLEAEGFAWECPDCAFEYGHEPGLWSSDNPHDLTAAMDVLIAVLETKGEKM